MKKIAVSKNNILFKKQVPGMLLFCFLLALTLLLLFYQAMQFLVSNSEGKLELSMTFTMSSYDV